MPRRFSNPFRALSRNIVVLSFVSFFNDISSESIARVLPVFLKESLKVSFTAIGWVEGIADSLSIVLRLLSGWIVDGAKRKKPFLVFGYGLSALVRPLFPPIVVLAGWPGALTLKILDRIGKAVRVVPRDALIAMESGKNNHGQAFGLNRAMDTFGALIGIVLVALIAQSFTTDGGLTLTETMFKTVVWSASIAGFCGVLLIIFCVREGTLGRGMAIPTEVKRLSGSLRDLPREYYLYLACVCLFSLAGSSDAFLILGLRSAGFSLTATFWLIVGYNLVAALSAYPISRATDRWRSRKAPLVAGWIIYSAAYLVFGLFPSAWWLGLGFIGYGLYYGFVESTEKALVADLAPATHVGRAFGLFNFLTGAMLLPANLIFGIISDRWGMPTAFFLGAALSACAAGALACLRITRRA